MVASGICGDAWAYAVFGQFRWARLDDVLRSLKCATLWLKKTLWYVILIAYMILKSSNNNQVSLEIGLRKD